MAKPEAVAEKTKAAGAATTEPAKKDRSNYGEVVLDSFMWRGGASKSDLIGRIIGKGVMDTQYKTEKNPDGSLEYVELKTTEPATWGNDEGPDTECPVGAVVKVPITAGMVGLAELAERALRLGKAPEVVIKFTGQIKTLPNKFKMKIYKANAEPVAEWPSLAEIAPAALPVAGGFEVSQITDGNPAPKQLGN